MRMRNPFLAATEEWNGIANVQGLVCHFMPPESNECRSCERKLRTCQDIVASVREISRIGDKPFGCQLTAILFSALYQTKVQNSVNRPGHRLSSACIAGSEPPLITCDWLFGKNLYPFRSWLR
jgi:hypothetical protein